ncbi:hypothetical protein H0H92_012954 [Tricholoma furcatifolium]|nr:hypothetical protein H0H92_012954 [Tricholoma furcatifolium]
MTGEGQPVEELNPTGMKQCVKAAVGIGYNEHTLLIATRSRHVPPPLNDSNQYSTIDSSVRDGIHQSSSPEYRSFDWENWVEEDVINVSEVQLMFNGIHLGLSSEPLPPILGCGKTIVDLNFISLLPSADIPNPPPSPRKTNERLGPNVSKHAWKIAKNGSRSYSSNVVAFVIPVPIRSRLEPPVIFAGILETSGPSLPVPGNLKKLPIGTTKALNLPDLSDNTGYEASPISTDFIRFGHDVPLKAVLSPNGALLCMQSSSMWPMRNLIQPVPRLKPSTDVSDKWDLPLSLAPSFIDAVTSGRAPDDISHSLSLFSAPLDGIVEALYQADVILDDQSSAFSHSSTLKVLGGLIEIYKTLAFKTSNEDLTPRWNTAHDICSLVSSNMAFNDCMDGDTYDLTAVWQLIGLSTWIISLAEKVLKECVLFCDLSSEEEKKASDENTYMSALPLESSVLLHLVHPFAFDNFLAALSHVQKFSAYIRSLTARGENAQIARDVVIDLINNSGIDISALISQLEDTRQELRALDRENCRRALVSCRPTCDMHSLLSKTIRNVMTNASIITKPTLFIKPHDLVDGLSNLSDAPKKGKDRDVVTKGILVNIATMVGLAVRYGGRSGRNNGHYAVYVEEDGETRESSFNLFIVL